MWVDRSPLSWVEDSVSSTPLSTLSASGGRRVRTRYEGREPHRAPLTPCARSPSPCARSPLLFQVPEVVGGSLGCFANWQSPFS